MIPNVLSAAMSRGCTMLHPGYGFLSENAVFVDMCREHGINFIGPNVSFLSDCLYKVSIMPSILKLGKLYLLAKLTTLLLHCQHNLWSSIARS